MAGQFRRAVPAALRAVIGRCEIVRSLKTRDRREARRLAQVHAVEAENLLAQARGGGEVLAQLSSASPAVPDLAALIEAAVRRALNIPNPSPEPASDGLRLDEAFTVIGTSDSVTVANWFASGANHVATLQTSDGHVLADSAAQNLVNAMATLTPPPIGQTTLTTQQHQQLDPVIAANWH